MRRAKFRVIAGGAKKKTRLWRKLFAVGILVLSGFLLWNSMEYITLLAAKVTVASHTRVQYGVPVECVVIRDEDTILAPQAGQYIPVLENGTRVKAGQVFARIEGRGGTVNLSAPSAGLICHGSDGLEKHLVMGRELDEPALQTVAGYLQDIPARTEAFEVEQFAPAAAIITNYSYQLLTRMDNYAEGKRQTLSVALADGSKRILSIIPREMLRYDNLYWVVWDSPSVPDELGLQRVLTAELVTETQELVLVPDGALYTRDGVRGVFVLYRNKPIFNPVEVLYTESGYVGVSGLADGQVVLSLPKWASFAKGWWQR